MRGIPILYNIKKTSFTWNVEHCHFCSWKWRIVVIGSVLRRTFTWLKREENSATPSDGPRSSAEPIDCKTLQNHYNAIMHRFQLQEWQYTAFQVNTVTQFVWVARPVTQRKVVPPSRIFLVLGSFQWFITLSKNGILFPEHCKPA